MTTKNKIAEQALRILSGGSPTRDSKIAIQEIMIAVEQAFAYTVKLAWFQNKNEGLSELNGTYVYTFRNQDIIQDTELNQYYTALPGSYIDLPHELGIQTVAFMPQVNKDYQPVSKGSQDDPIVRVPNGFLGLTRGLAVGALENRIGYYVEGTRIYYVNMTKSNYGNKVMIKLAVSLDGIDQDEQINIPPEVQKQIVDMVVERYAPEQIAKKDIVNDNNKVNNPPS